MFKKILAALMCVVVVLVSGCGGGGGGSGGGSAGISSDPVSLSVSQRSVVVAATLARTAPTATVVASVDHVPSGGLYVQGSYSAHGIANVSLSNSGNSENLLLNFRTPASLGVGTYTDTVLIQVCRDQACTQQVANSPIQISVSYTVTADVAIATSPALSAIYPTLVTTGGSDFVLTVYGSWFDSTAQVYWNGIPKSTTYVSATQLTAQILASDIATAGTYPVMVRPGGNPNVQSDALPVIVTSTAFSLSQLSPTSVTAGNLAFVETVLGSGFDSSAVVQWNGSSRPTTFVSATELLAQISASDVASAGTANITVTKTGSSASSAKTVTVVAPSIDATAFQINAQHTGTISFANIVAPSAFPLSRKWTASMNGTPSYAMVAGGRVFATAQLLDGTSELTAFSAATGARLWGPIAIPDQANATYDNGRVFVLTSGTFPSGLLFAYDAASGTPLWRTVLASDYGFSGPPTAAHGMVYFGAGGNRILYAVDQALGSLTWSQRVSGGDRSAPTVTADGVYVSYSCHTYDFRPLTGELVWSDNTGCTGSDGATGSVANGIVYSPNVSNGYSGMSFNAETGAFVSSYAASAPPVVGTQMGYFLQSGALRAVNLSNGTTQWSFAGDGGLASAPVLVNNYVFVSSSTGNLYALDATTGSQLWQTNLGGAMANSYLNTIQLSGLSAGGGLLVVPAGNSLVAFTLSSNP